MLKNLQLCFYGCGIRTARHNDRWNMKCKRVWITAIQGQDFLCVNPFSANIHAVPPAPNGPKQLPSFTQSYAIADNKTEPGKNWSRHSYRLSRLEIACSTFRVAVCILGFRRTYRAHDTDGLLTCLSTVRVNVCYRQKPQAP